MPSTSCYRSFHLGATYDAIIRLRLWHHRPFDVLLIPPVILALTYAFSLRRSRNNLGRRHGRANLGGNPPLIDLLGKGCDRLLDIGCGAGDNAALIKSRYPECHISGITHSAAEAELAQKHMTRCWVFNIEDYIPDDLANQSFDALIFSHVLEHLRDPAVVLHRFSRLLRKGGQTLIAVPNVLSWRMRLQFVMGNFEYESSGALDDSHLRFFTYFTADQYLLLKSPDLKLTNKLADGSVPLWWLRRHVFPRSWSECIDRWGSRRWPNLFSGQVLIRAVKLT